jgi:hypothetical protein
VTLCKQTRKWTHIIPVYRNTGQAKRCLVSLRACTHITTKWFRLLIGASRWAQPLGSGHPTEVRTSLCFKGTALRQVSSCWEKGGGRELSYRISLGKQLQGGGGKFWSLSLTCTAKFTWNSRVWTVQTRQVLPLQQQRHSAVYCRMLLLFVWPWADGCVVIHSAFTRRFS